MRNLFKTIKNVFIPKKLEELEELPNTGNIHQDVITYLQKGGTLTSEEAKILFGTSRLSSIINRARRRGLAIKTDMIDVPNRHGNLIKIAQYSIIR